MRLKLKKTIKKIHLWLGFISGLLIFIIAITGVIYAFQEEIQDFTQKYRYSSIEKKSVLLPSQLERIAKNKLPGEKIHSILYNEAGRSAEILFYNNEPNYYYKIYINPYSGKILHVQNMDKGFFNFILKGHMYLWLPPTIGGAIVLIATLLFLFIILSGFFLWFSKKWKIIKNRIWFRWKSNASWKRKNWDLHAIFGFYTFIFSLIFIVTSLVWIMPGFAQFYHHSLGGKKAMTYEIPAVKKFDKIKSQSSLDTLFLKINKSTVRNSIDIHPAESDSSAFLVQINPQKGTYWKTDYRYFNPDNLKEITVKHIYSRYQDASTADKILRMNYDIHVGAIGGIIGKIIAFISGLLISSLPITGFIIWWNRQRKKFRKIPQK